ncbi:MAG TPA: VacJ family lipoprotein [Rhizomicrobium sp.]|nr:VacJ family lipoprotein [Rhizomicrobium sp.]
MGLRTATVFGLGLLLAGCADNTAQMTSDPNDPWESWNRKVLSMNMSFDHAVLKPTAEAYVSVVPEPARNGLHNFLTNLDSPVIFANDLLQGEFELAGETLGRFGLNSTAGLAGLIDVATPAGLPRHASDFGQTLGVWGLGANPYLVLPLLGPSNPRDFVGYVADTFMDPLNYVGIREIQYWEMGRGAAVIIDQRAGNMEMLDQLDQSSVDKYATMRSLYRQYRDAHIRHGQQDVKDLPNM